MGLDAKMYLVIPKDVTDLQVAEAAVDVQEFFFFGYEYVKPNCLKVVKEPIFDYYEVIKLSDGERVVDVDCFDRYYGENYERGHYPNIKLVSEFLEKRFPGSRQFYGSDYSGVSPFSVQDREELWAHWCEVGTRPYHGKTRVLVSHVGDSSDGKMFSCWTFVGNDWRIDGN